MYYYVHEHFIKLLLYVLYNLWNMRPEISASCDLWTCQFGHNSEMETACIITMLLERRSGEQSA
jgi:hypothetical protein